MDPNELKDYTPAYVPQYSYPSDLPPMYSSEYQAMGGMQMGQGTGVMNPYLGQPPPQPVYQQPTTPQADPPPPVVKPKGKRRSKNDTEGRNYKCKQCERTYLSYPALYTHIKTKHASTTEPPATTGRGRGRPKKTVPAIFIFLT